MLAHSTFQTQAWSTSWVRALPIDMLMEPGLRVTADRGYQILLAKGHSPSVSSQGVRAASELDICQISMLLAHQSRMRSSVMHSKLGAKLLQSNFCCQARPEQRLVIHPLAQLHDDVLESSKLSPKCRWADSLAMERCQVPLHLQSV